MKKTFTNYLMLFALLFAGQFNSQVWESVGSNAGISTGVAGRLTLVNDYQNKLVVGYFDADALKGSVQKFDGTGWAYVGGAPGITPSFTTYNSTSVDNNGVIYFTNQAAFPATGMEVRKFENNVWTQLPNMTDASINFNTTAITADNTLIAANNENSGTVKKLVNGVWQQIGANGFTGGVPYFLDMVAGNNGKIYISFNNNGNVHVYENDVNASATTPWQPVGGIANLAAAPNTEDYNSSLAIDGNNNLFVAYVSSSAGGNKLNVKKFDGSSWSQLGSENFSQFRAKHTSIVVGANNIVYVAYSKWEDADLLKNFVVAYSQTTNTWSQVGTGFASEGQGIFNSLSVDSFGNLFLAFADSGLGKLSVKKLNLAIAAAESVNITTQNGDAPEILTDNGTLQLKATVNPSAANQNVTWSIAEGETFATVSSSGLVTAIASDAVVKVKAQSVENASISNIIEVNIKNQNSDVDAQTVTIKTENGGYPDISAIGNTLQLIATVSPAEADQKVTWSVQQGTGFVSINDEGLVTALAEGTAVIRATHLDGAAYGEMRVSVFKNGCSQGNGFSIAQFGYSISKNQVKGIDDFVVSQGTRFTASKLRFSIIATSVDDLLFDINFLKDDNGIPGSSFKQFPNVPVSSTKIVKDLDFGQYRFEVEVDLPEPTAFDQGTYWLNPVAISSQETFWEVTAQGGIGQSYHFDNLDGNGWRKLGDGGFNAAFEITGSCTPMPLVVGTLNGEDESVSVGESLPLKVIVNAQGISQGVDWSLESGNAFASINANGVVTGLAAGTALVKATSVDDENVFSTLLVTVVDPNACAREAVSNNFENAFLLGGPTDQRLAVDFEVQGSSFTIDSVEPTVANFATSFNFTYYKDENGLPGAKVADSNGEIIRDVVTGSEFDVYFHRYTVKLDHQVTLPTGKYWMEMKTNALAWEATSADVQGNFAAFFNTDTNEWGYLTGGEFVYKLNGICLSETMGTDDINDANKVIFYPNPVKDILNISSDEKILNVEIYNMVGQKILRNRLNESKVKVNVTHLLSGTYIVETTTVSGKAKRFKIIKN